jgi:GT2 family glycosyltransferase
MYMEDLDLCYRFKQAGWIVWYEPSATVIHVKAGTSGQHRSWKLNRAFHYGMYRFYRTHYAADANPLERAAVYTGIAGKLLISAARSAIARARNRPHGRGRRQGSETD